MTATVSDVRHELDDVVRGACGGMLFGIPLLYTMEVWWAGGTTGPVRMLAVMTVAFVPIAMLIHVSGFRRTIEVRVRDTLMDAVEAMAIALVGAALLLLVLGEIGPGVPFAEALGKIVYEAVPFAIGVALARHFFTRARDEPDDGSARGNGVGGTLADLGATSMGSVFIAFNIAPTEEVPMLASGTTALSLMILVMASLMISYAVVFEAGFADQDKRRGQVGVLQHPHTETVVAYLVALIASAAMLWFFDNLSAGDWQNGLSEILVLGLPAAVGGAAGRLAI